ncbi:hypothetical protein ACFX2I_031395 [Malus domestica]
MPRKSVLNRFIALKAEEKKKPRATPIPRLRREIGRKVAEIQNEALGEHRTCDLNDKINKLIREKVHWERQIVELGGPNYAKNVTDLDNNIGDVPNSSGRGPGYRCFGYDDGWWGWVGVDLGREKGMEVKRVEERGEVGRGGEKGGVEGIRGVEGGGREQKFFLY